jgi:DNA-binding NtrC family response regulator
MPLISSLRHMRRSKKANVASIELFGAQVVRRSTLAGEAAPGTVLVVEDDDSMRDSLDTLLSLSGYRTVLYGSAEAVLTEDAIERPLCIVSDLNLPAMSGLDLLIELRRRSCSTPVIIITAFDSPSTRREAMRRGAAAYAALLAAIHNITPAERPV